MAATGLDNPARDDDVQLQCVEACIAALSKTCQVRAEKVDGRRSFVIQCRGVSRRVVFGNEPDVWHHTGDQLIVLGWGKMPMPFLVAPSHRIELLDLRFKVHSRALSEIGAKLKTCLESQGIKFREFDSANTSAKRNSRIRRLRGKARRILSVGDSPRSTKGRRL